MSSLYPVLGYTGLVVMAIMSYALIRHRSELVNEGERRTRAVALAKGEDPEEETGYVATESSNNSDRENPGNPKDYAMHIPDQTAEAEEANKDESNAASGKNLDELAGDSNLDDDEFKKAVADEVEGSEGDKGRSIQDLL